MITPKTPEEIAIMREGGKKLGKILLELLEQSKPGVVLMDLEQYARRRIAEEGGEPSFTTVEGYPYVTCLCINEEVVHGMPSSRILHNGDIFTIDIGMVYQGLHTDTAWTKLIGDGGEERQQKEAFLAVGEKTLWEAIKAAKAGNHIGHISQVIQQNIESAGYSVVKELTGHAVGKLLHEEPMIPGFVRGDIFKTPELIPGMTIAIEIIYAAGKGSIVYSANNDGWTLESKDRSSTACFEHTVAIGTHKTSVLTKTSS